MLVVKWSDKVEGSGDDINSPLCGGLYKEEKYIIHWSGTDSDAKMNCSLGPKRTMIGLFQKTNMMKNSRTGEDLYIMVNFFTDPQWGNKRQRRHAPSMQDVPGLMEFLDNKSQLYPSSTTRINAMSILSTMGCGAFSHFQTHAIKIKGGIFFYTNLDFHCTMSRAMYRVF